MRRVFLILYSFCLLGLFLAIFFRPITAINEDLGRHILLGNIILRTHLVPKINLLSYTHHNFPFINTSWLSAVVFSLIHDLGGFKFLLLSSVITAGTAISLQLTYVLTRYLKLAVLVPASLYLLVLSQRSNVRPEIFSMFFLSVFIVLLFSFRYRPTRLIFLLVPLEVLWVNMHIYFFLGPALLLLFLLDNLWVSKFAILRSTKILAGIFIASLFATLVNPNGFKGAIFPLTVFQNYGFPVTENQNLMSLFFIYRDISVFFPVLIILLLAFLLMLGRSKARPIDWLLTIIFSFSVIVVARNSLLFVFTTFISFVFLLDNTLRIYSNRLRSLSQRPFLILYPLSILMIAAFTMRSIGLHGIGYGLDERGSEVGDFLIKNNISGPLYNNFDNGSYLAYRLYPKLMYIDNRPEAYPAEFFKNIYIPMQTNPKIFEKEDTKYRFNALILAKGQADFKRNALMGYLFVNQNFRLVYEDNYFYVFLRNTQDNGVLTHSFEHIRSKQGIYKSN